MSVRKFVDTNILVYAIDETAQEKQAVAETLLRRSPREYQMVLSTQVLQEFYTVSTRKLLRPLDERSAQRAVASLSRQPVVQVDTDMIRSGIALSRKHKLNFWDALIIRAAQRGGCTELLTEDFAAGTQFDQVTVVNPFGS